MTRRCRSRSRPPIASATRVRSRTTTSGAALGDQYVAATAATQPDNVLVRFRPERWLSVDYAKECGAL